MHSPREAPYPGSMNTLSSVFGFAMATAAAAAILLTPACGELISSFERSARTPTQEGQAPETAPSDPEKQPIKDALNTLGAAVIDGVLEPVNVATQQLPPEAQALTQAALAALDHALDQALQAILRNDVTDADAAAETVDKLRTVQKSLHETIH